VPQVRVSFALPYRLRINPGDYPVGGGGHPLIVTQQAEQTHVSRLYEHADEADPDRQAELKARYATKLLRQVNRLLRWYRVKSQRPEFTDLTLAQVSPVVFDPSDGAPEGWGAELRFESSPLLIAQEAGADALSPLVREGLASGTEPDVADLFLLDAASAIREGRYREAVLFCWSTIDSTFNRRYDQIVEQELAGEWEDGRNWLKDNYFGMKNKMTAVLFLLRGRSLFREPDHLWEDLNDSYRKRNAIIHQGALADEADAERALKVARRVVAFVRSLP
jgi:hypothetical protein